MSTKEVKLDGCSKAIQNVGMLFQSVDDKGKLVYVNSAWLKKLGYTKKETIGMSVWKVIPKEYKNHCKEIFKDVVRGKKFHNIETEFMTKKGKRIFVKGDIIPIKDKNKFKYTISAFKDITDLKLDSTKYKDFIVNHRGISYLSYLNGKPVFFEGNIGGITGYKKSDFVGGKLAWQDLILKEDFKNISPGWKKLAKTPNTSLEREYRIKNKEGKIVWIQDLIKNLQDEKGKISFVQGELYDITSKKEAEQKSLEEKKRAENYLDIAGVIIVVINEKGIVTEINKRGIEILGHPKNKIIGKNWFDNFLPPKIRRDVKKVFMDVLKGKEKLIVSYENPIVSKKGEERVINWHNTLLKDSDGKIIGALSSGEDVTDKKRIEGELQNYHLYLEDKVKERTAQLSKSEKKYRSIFEGTNDGILAVDPKTKRFIFANPRMSKITGYSNKELLGMKVPQIHPKKDLPKVIKALKDQKKGKSLLAQNIPILKKNGKIIYCNINASPLNVDGKKYLVGSFRDITQRKEAETKLFESEKKYRDLFESSQDAVMILRPPTWKFTTGNPATLRIFGAKSEKEFTTTGPWAVSPKYQPDGQLSSVKAKKMINKAMKEGSNFFEWSHKKMDGRVFPATVLLSRMEEGENKFLQATVRDITEQKMAERKIEEQIERLKGLDELKSKFLTITSHELKTPITPAKLQMQMMLEGQMGDLTNEQKHSAKIIQRNIIRLEGLIDDILEVSRIEAAGFKFHMKKANISKVVEDIVESSKASAKKKGLKLKFKKDKGVLNSKIDKQRISQVVVNLLDNAIKFTEKGEILVSVKKHKQSIIVSVKDSGEGIDKKHINKIFDEFYQVEPMFTREHGGTGLGLSIAKKIIENHHGEIGVKSQPKKGSTFYFSIPIKNGGKK